MDVLILGFPGEDRWFDVAPWVDMAKNSNTKILVNKEFYRHQFGLSEITDEELEMGLTSGSKITCTREDYLRCAAESYKQGADGIYIFNNWTQPKMLLGLDDSEFIKRWDHFENTDHLDSAAISID